MKTFKTKLLTIAMLLCSISVSAYDFEVDGIYYSITSSKDLKVEVTRSGYTFAEYKGAVVIPESVTYTYYNETYSVTSIGYGAFRDCTGLTSITIPNSVTSIRDDAFRGCTGLTSITIPNSVTSIGDDAFRGCTGLTSITIPNSVTNIGGRAFYGCTGLTSITIPNSVTSIGENAFYGCTGLTSITIPNSVTSIEEKAFSGCTGLKEIYIEDGAVALSLAKCPFYDCPLAILHLGRNIIYFNFEYSNYTPFYCKETLKNITIGDKVTYIVEDAFYGCTGLTSITIPNSVTSIGDYAFRSCTGLTSITIPNSVTSIGYRAFSGCSGLTSIIIGNSVTSIGNYAFDGCKNLKTVINLSDIAISKDSDSNGCVGKYATKIIHADEQVGNFFFTTTYETHSLVYYLKIKDDKEIVLPDNYKGENYEIGNYLFSGCTGLTSITIPNSVTSIGEGAFYDCI